MLYNELCKSKGIIDQAEVENLYFNLMSGERNLLKETALNLGRIYKDFYSLVKIFESDLENHYNLDKRRGGEASQNASPKF
jgi:hypothetical protein